MRNSPISKKDILESKIYSVLNEIQLLSQLRDPFEDPDFRDCLKRYNNLIDIAKQYKMPVKEFYEAIQN